MTAKHKQQEVYNKLIKYKYAQRVLNRHQSEYAISHKLDRLGD